MPRFVGNPFNYAPYVVVQGIQIWAIRRPEFLGPKHINIESQFWTNKDTKIICHIFNVYDLYRRFSSAIRRIVGSLTQSTPIFATIVLDPPKSALELFRQLRGSLWCVLSSDSSSPAYWNFCWTVLKSYTLSQRHKRLISGIQRTKLFPLLSAQREGPSRLFDYTPHLVSTSRLF